MYSYDRTPSPSIQPKWEQLPGSFAETTVQPDGTAEFLGVFGPATPDEMDLPPHYSRLILVRAGPEVAALYPDDTRPIPVLAYRLRNLDSRDQEEVVRGRINLEASWKTITFNEANRIFNRLGDDPESISTSIVWGILRRYWERLLPEYIDLRDDYIERIIKVGAGVSPIPASIPRQAFCGVSPAEGFSIWRLFQNIVDLVGRSIFIRALLATRQLYILSLGESVTIHTDKLAELGQPFVFFFRLPRSIVSESILVMDLYRVDHGVGNATRLAPMRPTPYITATQIVGAQGNIFKAFANTNSSHKTILERLSPRGLLQPPNIQLQNDETPATHGIPLSKFPRLLELDTEWWSRPNL